MALIIRSFASMVMFFFTLTSFNALARPVPEDSRIPAGKEFSRNDGSFELAKMSDSAKILIRDCIDDTELSLTPRRCVNLIKSIMESQKGALGASLSIDQRHNRMLSLCKHKTRRQRGCENLVEKLIGLATSKPQVNQTAYASQIRSDESEGAR